MRINNRLAAAVVCLVVGAALFAQEDEENLVQEDAENIEIFEENTAEVELEENIIENIAKVELKVDIPVFDFPYQADIMQAMDYNFFQTYSAFSMNQSLKLTTGVYSAMHYGLKKMYENLDFKPFWNKAIYYGTTAAGIFALGYWLPFSYTWMDREYTHSILNLHGIHGFNSHYHVFINRNGLIDFTDDELGVFKQKAPYDFIRMNSAGHEAYSLFSDTLIRKYFYYALDDLSWISALIATWVNFGLYPGPFIQNLLGSPTVIIIDLSGATMMDSETLIKEWYKNDKGQETRALTGLNMFNWGYELFHPDEPYTARGLHPSGDGSVARYITLKQFSDDEMKYLVKHSLLSYLNYVSPLLFGFRSFPLGNSGFEGNFALRHYLTSFGTDITISVFLKKKPFNMAFTYHNNQNYENYFPAIEAELVDYPLHIGKLEMLLSPRVLIGMQPKDQEFRTNSPEFMGLFGLRVDYMASKHVFPYLDFSVKTRGWVAGNEYLGANACVKLGVSLRF
jgi:hypothetical protein